MKPQLPDPLRKELDHVLDFFHKHYPEVKLYLVGGAVRDMVMGREIYDLDIECFGIDPESFDAAMHRLGAKGVGKSFFVYKYGHLDIALPRIERKVGEGHRGFAVELAKDTKEASRRRDFTMNALMLDLQSGEIVDHWGGLKDIQKRLIRVVDPKKFTEDSLRVLRAMRSDARAHLLGVREDVQRPLAPLRTLRDDRSENLREDFGIGDRQKRVFPDGPPYAEGSSAGGCLDASLLFSLRSLD